MKPIADRACTRVQNSLTAKLASKEGGVFSIRNPSGKTNLLYLTRPAEAMGRKSLHTTSVRRRQPAGRGPVRGYISGTLHPGQQSTYRPKIQTWKFKSFTGPNHVSLAKTTELKRGQSQNHRTKVRLTYSWSKVTVWGKGSGKSDMMRP